MTASVRTLARHARSALDPAVRGRLTRRLARRASAPLRALPDFVIVGAQKAGTSSLYHYLTLHPRVEGASTKEVHFFDTHFDKGLAWYRSHFPVRASLTARRRGRERLLTGEASPYYLYHPHVAARIARHLPEARLLVLLRDPVDRALSHYWYMVQLGREPLPLDEAFAREAERLDAEKARLAADPGYRSVPHSRFSYRDRGLYAEQLGVYLRHVDRRQLRVLSSERMFADPQAVFDEACAHLNLAPHPLPTTRRVNAGTARPAASEASEAEARLRGALRDYYRPHNERLWTLLGVDEPWWP